MIRINGHLCKLNSLVFSDFYYFSFYQESIDVSSLTCPHCKALGNCSFFASYDRYLISVEEGIRVDYTVTVKRVLCSSCDRTHSLLPDVLIPFGSYSLRFILHILQAYLLRKVPVSDFCEYWQISVSTLYDWIHTFMEHYELFFGILYRLNWICLDALHKASSFPFLTSRFFEAFHFSFMQLRYASCCRTFLSDS